MARPELRTVDVADLEVVSCRRDIRRDLHAFVRGVRERSIRRTYRENRIPKAEALRLAALLGDDAAGARIEAVGSSAWLDGLDDLAWRLGLVKYKRAATESRYGGGGGPYPDNFMTVDEGAYASLLAKPIAEQEGDFRSALLGEEAPCESEFFQAGPMARLDRFDRFGCKTGVLRLVRFPEVRRRLLEILAGLEAGRWYAADSLVRHLRQAAPCFLIPKAASPAAGARGAGRYQNFRETIDARAFRTAPIGEAEPRAFERVEGRYVERFLEGAPLALGYVDVAYGEAEIGDVQPSYGALRAFRPTAILERALRQRLERPRVVVLPDFEVHVDSELYPAAEISALLPIAGLRTDGPHAVLRLERPRVAQAAADDGTDAVEVLRALAGGRIPPNVEAELRAWTARSAAFTVYDGFALLETEEVPKSAEGFVVSRVSPGVAIVESPARLAEELDREGFVPERVRHDDNALSEVAHGASSAFARAARPAPAKKAAVKAVLRRSVRLSLRFPDPAFFEAFRKAALDRARVLQWDEATRTVSYSRAEEEAVRDILGALKAERDFRIEEDRG